VQDAGLRVGLHTSHAVTVQDARLRAQALAGAHSVLLWVRDAAYHAEALQHAWREQGGAGDPRRAWQPEWTRFTAARLRLEDLSLPDGAAGIRWFDTRSGDVVVQQRAEVRDGRLELSRPAFDRDLAAIVVAQE